MKPVIRKILLTLYLLIGVPGLFASIILAAVALGSILGGPHGGDSWFDEAVTLPFAIFVFFLSCFLVYLALRLLFNKKEQQTKQTPDTEQKWQWVLPDAPTGEGTKKDQLL